MGEYGPEKSESIFSSSSQQRSADKTQIRIAALEDQVREQRNRIKHLEQILSSVQKDGRRSVSVLQYNILASYLGMNTQPWFLYGAELTEEDRNAIIARYYEKHPDGSSKYLWPAYVEGILTPAEISEVERQNELYFKWEIRRTKLIDQLRCFDADVISLVELDQHDYFMQCIGDEWDSVFHKRPRCASLDGCGLFWRRSKFELLAQQAIDMIDGSDAKGRAKRDRSCIMVLLRWVGLPASTPPLVCVSTHLAKDPYDKTQTALRVRQVTQIMATLTEFTKLHGATESPVVLCGDLNARHLGEIRGIARTVWQIKGDPIHKFLWSASDVNTGPTSITKARQCRIDVVQFLSSHMEVLEVTPVPRLCAGEVIPNAEHPSDHFPVCVRFRIKDTYQKHRECAKAWLECVLGREKVHPLTDDELWQAFEFFDREGSDYIERYDFEEACTDLHSGLSEEVIASLLECFPNQKISYSNFIRAYEARLSSHRLRSIGDLEAAFRFFAGDSGVVELKKLESVFRDITPVSFSDEEVKEMILRLNIKEGQEYVNLHDFCEVVCHATFPHRQVHMQRMKTQFTRAVSPGSDLDENTCFNRHISKEIQSKLQDFNASLHTPSYFVASPDASPKLANDINNYDTRYSPNSLSGFDQLKHSEH